MTVVPLITYLKNGFQVEPRVLCHTWRQPQQQSKAGWWHHGACRYELDLCANSLAEYLPLHTASTLVDVHGIQDGR